MGTWDGVHTAPEPTFQTVHEQRPQGRACQCYLLWGNGSAPIRGGENGDWKRGVERGRRRGEHKDKKVQEVEEELQMGRWISNGELACMRP